MKANSTLILTSIFWLSITSCGGSAGNQPATAAGFSDIEQEIISKFGEDAYFTDISLTYDKSVGNIIGVTVTEDPETLRMEQWNQMKGYWKQNSEISLEVPKESKAKDFMYQLGREISMSVLGGLVEEAKAKLKTERNQQNSTLKEAFILFPDNGEISRTKYSINLQPKNGGTKFNFLYDLNGKLIKMDY